MNASAFLAVLPRQLRFWTFHCALNALPSLSIALIFLQLWESPIAIAAMLFAIATFILLYATVTSLRGPLSDEEHVLSRSLKLGAKIRAWISVISVPLVLTFKGILLVPDFWCGMFAINTLNRIASLSGASDSNPFRPRPIRDIEGFFRIYTTTMTEGVILSFLLLMISFFAVMFVQSRDRRKFFALADSR